MGFGSNYSILNGQMIYIEKSKLNIADMWLIPLDRVTISLLTKTGQQNTEIPWGLVLDFPVEPGAKIKLSVE